MFKLETERLLIRSFQSSDVSELYQVLSKEEVMKFIEKPFTLEETSKFVTDAGLIKKPLVYALVWKASEKVIGHVIFHSYDDLSYEIGWIINRDYWEKGIASEITEALQNKAREMNIRSLVMECDCKKTATIHIANKFGFLPIDSEDNLLIFRKELE